MVYLDNSATTIPEKAVCDKVCEMMTDCFANPSSFHSQGVKANIQLRQARESVARALSCNSDEIYFTSGGTEANNLALFGAAAAKRRTGNRIVTTAIEHESVLFSADELEKQGFEVIRIKPDKFGRITKEQIDQAVNKDTILVSMMHTNNEVGTVLPVEYIKSAVKRAQSSALIHIDCVQAFGKTAIKPSKLGADLLTVTAHKIHGPKGTGALYVKKGVRIMPRSFGGEQEKRLRPGTEAMPLIAGFGKACELIGNINENADRIKSLNLYARRRLEEIGGIVINSPDDASPYILNFRVATFMTSQTVVQHLSGKYDICVSNGSACAKGRQSHVLSAMGLDKNTIDKSIRVSFSRNTSKEDIDALISAIDETVKQYPE